MVQFNLLPDVKIEYIKSQRSRRLVFGLSLMVSMLAVALLVLMLSYDGLQKKHLSDLSRDIASESKTLRGKPNIDTILTVQNQLQSLTALHAAKPAATRLATFINETTPANVTISSLTIDFTKYTVSISGNADSLSSVNKYVDTLKLTTYTSTDPSTKEVTTGQAFSSVVLSSFGLSNSSKDKSKAASYNVTFIYDPKIFDITKEVTLTVPSITTHAQLQAGTDVFNAGGSN